MPDKQNIQWKWKAICGILLLMSLLILLLGLAMQLFVINFMVKKGIKENSQLLEGSRLMEKWENPEYKLQFKIHVHSVENPDEIMVGQKPKVKGMGPYVFDELLENQVVKIESGKVKYKRHVTYFFNPDESCQTCILGNRVWVPNMIYQKFVEAASTAGMKAAATTLLSQTAFLEVEVGELLFDGYKDPFLDKVCDIPFMNFVCDSILDLPDRIGFFYEKNNTADDTFEILDGTANPKDLGKIVSWNDKNLLDESWWSNKEARKIVGTEGSLFAPFISKSDKLWVFVTQLCRSIWLEFDKEVDFDGIPAYRFILPGDALDASLPENEGFCNPTEKKFFESQKAPKMCFPRGLLEISKCQRSQPPIVISLPNFLFADEEVVSSVEGLNTSDVARDSIIVDLEPRSGVVLQAQRRSQVNIEMWKGKDLNFPVNLQKMKSVIVPVLIVHEDARIDADSLHALRTELLDTEQMAYTTAIILMIVGVVLLILATLLTLYKCGLYKRCLTARSHNITPLPNYEPRSHAKI